MNRKLKLIPVVPVHIYVYNIYIVYYLHYLISIKWTNGCWNNFYSQLFFPSPKKGTPPERSWFSSGENHILDIIGVS